MKLTVVIASIFLLSSILSDAKKTDIVWRKLLKENANCVTWVSVTAKVKLVQGVEAWNP